MTPRNKVEAALEAVLESIRSLPVEWDSLAALDDVMGGAVDRLADLRHRQIRDELAEREVGE